MAALATGLNFLLLNLALVIVSVPIVTLPLGIFDGPLRPLVVDHGERVSVGRLPFTDSRHDHRPWYSSR